MVARACAEAESGADQRCLWRVEPCVIRSAFILAALILAAPAHATHDDIRSLNGMQSHDRVLLVFAPSLRDPRLEAERRVMAQFALDAASRDLRFVQVAQGHVLGAHDRADDLRARFHVPPGAWRALVIAKDGKVALTSDAPISGAQLRAAIDALPARRAEVRRAHAGLGAPKAD